MHNFGTKIGTHGAFREIFLTHCGICETGLISPICVSLLDLLLFLPYRDYIYIALRFLYVECDLLQVPLVSHAELVLQRTNPSPEWVGLFMPAVIQVDAQYLEWRQP